MPRPAAPAHAVPALQPHSALAALCFWQRRELLLPAALQGRPKVSVLKVDKSGGVVKRERDERRLARDARMREYFYG